MSSDKVTVKLIEEHVPGAIHRPLGSMLKQMALADGKVDMYAAIN